MPYVRAQHTERLVSLSGPAITSDSLLFMRFWGERRLGVRLRRAGFHGNT